MLTTPPATVILFYNSPNQSLATSAYTIPVIASYLSFVHVDDVYILLFDFQFNEKLRHHVSACFPDRIGWHCGGMMVRVMRLWVRVVVVGFIDLLYYLSYVVMMGGFILESFGFIILFASLPSSCLEMHHYYLFSFISLRHLVDVDYLFGSTFQSSKMFFVPILYNFALLFKALHPHYYSHFSIITALTLCRNYWSIMQLDSTLTLHLAKLKAPTIVLIFLSCYPHLADHLINSHFARYSFIMFGLDCHYSLLVVIYPIGF